MPSLLVLSADSAWSVPLTAMLREARVPVEPAQDLLAFSVHLHADPASWVVIGPDISAEDVSYLGRLLTMRPHPARRVMLVGEVRGSEGLVVGDAGAPPGHILDKWQLLELRQWAGGLAARAGSTGVGANADERTEAAAAPPHRAPREGSPSHLGAPREAEPAPEALIAPSPWEGPPGVAARVATWEQVAMPGAPPRLQPSDIRTLLRIARHETYYRLLGVSIDASREELAEAGRALALSLDDANLDPSVADQAFRELRELRAALRDALEVLTHLPSRQLYDRGLHAASAL